MKQSLEVIRQTKDLAERTALIRKHKDLMPRVVAETTTGIFSKSATIRYSSKKKDKQNEKLRRSRKNRVVCGVYGGIAEYFDVDPTIVPCGFS